MYKSFFLYCIFYFVIGFIVLCYVVLTLNYIFLMYHVIKTLLVRSRHYNYH